MSIYIPSQIHNLIVQHVVMDNNNYHMVHRIVKQNTIIFNLVWLNMIYLVMFNLATMIC